MLYCLVSLCVVVCASRDGWFFSRFSLVVFVNFKSRQLKLCIKSYPFFVEYVLITIKYRICKIIISLLSSTFPFNTCRKSSTEVFGFLQRANNVLND
jgi:hypothetical protein